MTEEAWHNTGGVMGAYLVASRALAPAFTDDELVAVGPNDFSASCEPEARRDFERDAYSGRMLSWKSCGGRGGGSALTLAAAPDGEGAWCCSR